MDQLVLQSSVRMFGRLTVLADVLADVLAVILAVVLAAFWRTFWRTFWHTFLQMYYDIMVVFCNIPYSVSLNCNCYLEFLMCSGCTCAICTYIAV